MSMMRILISFILIISFSISATIEGEIKDIRSNEPLIGANVMLKGTSLGSSTDENGYYIIQNISLGNYQLIVSYIGYEIKEEDIYIKSKQLLELDIKLVPQALKHQETTVTSNKRKEKITEAPASIEIISSNQIRRQSNANLGSFLKGMKGVDFTASGVDNYSISIRGFNSSFNTRALTITDGRVAALPALRVINYGSLPQSSEDIDKIEVVLGPATALYGANAHSGVINIVSKSPALSEGVNLNYSGSFDDRKFKKIDGRISKKINNKLSFKISSTYLKAYDWEYINEIEWKAHSLPWVGQPFRQIDGKDNNPWVVNSDIIDSVQNIYGSWVRIGDGEPNHGDLDGDGVAGEDWFNNHDDDGDGMVDEDYFYSDGVDNYEPIEDYNLNGLHDNDELFTDQNDNGLWDPGEQFIDIGNGIWDEGETCLSFEIEGICVISSLDDFIDIGDGVWTPAEQFTDWNGDGIWNGQNGDVDEHIDYYSDRWIDGIDNNLNGIIDEAEEGYKEDAHGPEWAYNLDNDIIIPFGRKEEYLLNDNLNPFYTETKIKLNHQNQLEYIDDPTGHVRGKYKYNEDEMTLIYDIYKYDFGVDGLAGDPFIDNFGDGIFTRGEPTHYEWSTQSYTYSDCGNDGFCWDEDLGGDLQQATFLFINNKLPVFDISGNPIYIDGPDSDGSEGNNQWDPGDNWQDINQDNESSINGDYGWFVVNLNQPDDSYFELWDSDNDGIFDSYKQNQEFNENLDVWPAPNGIWDIGEDIFDCGQDGFCWDYDNDNGQPQIAKDLFNNVIQDSDGDFIYIDGPDLGEGDNILIARDELEMDGIYDIGDNCYGCDVDENNNIPKLDIVYDTNGDGISDYPDFEVENRKVDIRIDYDFSNDFNATFQSGYSWSKTQQVTGIGRYLTEGWEYKYYQLRSRYKNWFAQIYLNQSYSGTTRGYNLGNVIRDNSKDISAQVQNHFTVREYNNFQTHFVWGIDYNKSLPKSFGSVLNDGPNGYDNDGDKVFLQQDGIDNNNNGLVDERGEPFSLRFNGKDDNNNGLIDEIGEGIDEKDEFDDVSSNEIGFYFQAKTALTWDNKLELITSARFDYNDQFSEDGFQFGPKIGLFYNPNDLYSYRFTYGRAFNSPSATTLHTDLYVGEQFIFPVYLRGNKNGVQYLTVDNSQSIVSPSYYDQNGVMQTIGSYDFGDNYTERVQNAPYFYNTTASIGAPIDLVPLDTSQFIIFIPSTTGDGVFYNEQESIDLVEIDPLKSEEIHSWEIGFKGLLTNKTILTIDSYISHYLDFFSPATFITPLVKDKHTGLTVGFMPTTDVGLNCPCGTAWDGIDNDGDWEAYADLFNWRDDKNDDGNPIDPGEWGFVDATSDTFYHPNEVGFDGNNIIAPIGSNSSSWNSVGVDEWNATLGLNEAELAPHPSITDSEGNPLMLPANASIPPQIILSSLNYGSVWMQGLDMGMTHIFKENLIFNGNISWYNTSSFFNELTRREEPINAPKFKFNLGLKWDSDLLGDFAFSYRHVDKFEWQDGIWSGVIGPYNIFDLHYNYKINNYLKFSVTGLNIFSDMHKELIGGAKMGRQVIFRLTSSF